MKLTGEVLEDEAQVNINIKKQGPNRKSLYSGKCPASVRKQSGDAGSSGLSASAANPIS